MDGTKWMELVNADLLKLPTRTLLSVSTRSKSDQSKTLYFGEFARALAYFGNMAQQNNIIEAYVTVHRLKAAKDLSELNLLNRTNFVRYSVTFLNYWEAHEG